MLHVIEIRNKALNLTIVNNLVNFFASSNHLSELLPKDFVVSQLQDGDITAGINRILESRWNTLNHPTAIQYDFIVADKQVHVILMTDVIGARFVLCSARSVTNIENLHYAYVGYDAPLTSVNQMFTVSHIKSDDWRYSISKPTTMVGE